MVAELDVVDVWSRHLGAILTECAKHVRKVNFPLYIWVFRHNEKEANQNMSEG